MKENIAFAWQLNLNVKRPNKKSKNFNEPDKVQNIFQVQSLHYCFYPNIEIVNGLLDRKRKYVNKLHMKPIGLHYFQ